MKRNRNGELEVKKPSQVSKNEGVNEKKRKRQSAMSRSD
jgi:hypothetical protein